MLRRDEVEHPLHVGADEGEESGLGLVAGFGDQLVEGSPGHRLDELCQAAEPGDGDIAIGGAALAAEAAALGLIDEYRVRVYPVLAGGGTPFFPRHGRRVALELAGTRTFSSGAVYLRYRVAR